MTPTGPLAVAANNHGDVGGITLRRLGERAILVDEIRHLRESIDLIVMLTIRERDNFIGELGPSRSAANWTRPWWILSICRLSRADFEPRGVIGTIRPTTLQFSLEFGNKHRTIGRIFNQDRIRPDSALLNFRALRLRSSNSHCARY